MNVYIHTYIHTYIYIYIYCRVKGPNSYIGSWVLSKDVGGSKKEQIVIRNSNLKSHEKKTNGRWSKEELLLGYGECNSSTYSSN